MNNPGACQVYLYELLLSIMNAQNQDEIDLDDPAYDSFTTLQF